MHTERRVESVTSVCARRPPLWAAPAAQPGLCTSVGLEELELSTCPTQGCKP